MKKRRRKRRRKKRKKMMVTHKCLSLAMGWAGLTQQGLL